MPDAVTVAVEFRLFIDGLHTKAEIRTEPSDALEAALGRLTDELAGAADEALRNAGSAGTILGVEIVHVGPSQPA